MLVGSTWSHGEQKPYFVSLLYSRLLTITFLALRFLDGTLPLASLHLSISPEHGQPEIPFALPPTHLQELTLEEQYFPDNAPVFEALIQASAKTLTSLDIKFCYFDSGGYATLNSILLPIAPQLKKFSCRVSSSQETEQERNPLLDEALSAMTSVELLHLGSPTFAFFSFLSHCRKLVKTGQTGVGVGHDRYRSGRSQRWVLLERADKCSSVGGFAVSSSG